MNAPTDEICREIFSEVLPYFEAVDFRILNLETPLTDKQKHSPIKKSGPNLICASENVLYLKSLGADVCTLANNHIGDYGEGAVQDTQTLLNTYDIRSCGVGKNLEGAYEACRLEKDGVSVSLISVCENEFGIATNATYGAAGYNARLLLKTIRHEKERSSTVIVVLHGGNEYDPLPSPDTQDRYRLICDMGADAVIAGHTHCPQGYEFYNGKPIVYSMGNFLFQSRSERSANDSWYYGLMSELNVQTTGIHLQLIPYRFDVDASHISVFKGKEKEAMLSYIECLSDIISDPEELDYYFAGWSYLHPWIPNAPCDFSNLQDYHAAAKYNLLCCESHASQAKRVLRFCYEENVEQAQRYAKKITELSEMPV